MKINKRDAQIVRKIIKYCNEIKLTHTNFMNDRELFFDKGKGFIYRNSISMPLLQIGELVKNLSDDFKASRNSVQWREIARMRDFFAHHYGALDYEMTWKTSRESISELKNYLESINSEDYES